MWFGCVSDAIVAAATMNPPPALGAYDVGRDAGSREGDDVLAAFLANAPADAGDGFDIGLLRFVGALHGDVVDVVGTMLSSRPLTVS